MQEKKIRIKIDSKGQYTITALEGYSGTSCVEATKTIEVAIGGTAVKSGKTPDYYAGDMPSLESITH